jgi:acyl transferase domain-containing protein/acyl carrier protein
VEYRTLDIEKPLIEQGFSQHFDVIIAVNVLHVTQNLTETLDRIHSLLAPDGLLLIQEITQPQLEFDITDGLLMHPLEDVQRSQGNPFLSKQQWQELLGDRAFNQVVAYGDADFGQHIFIAHASSSPKKDINDWFYIPSWQRSLQPPLNTDNHKHRWLIFLDERGLGDFLKQKLQLQGHDIVTVKVGTEFSSIGDFSYTLNPQQKADYNALIQELAAKNLLPSAIAHLWSVTDICELTIDRVSQAQARGFYSLLFLTQALTAHNCNPLQIKVVSNNMQGVVDEGICPQKATLVGLVKVIPQEYPHIRCCSIDITLPAPDKVEKLTDKLLAELTSTSTDIVAYRGGYRWIQNFLPAPLPIPELPIKQKGVYLIIGGLGSLGLVFAEFLAKTYQAKLILVGRSAVPSPGDRKYQKLLELEALGAEVMTLSADTANLEQMQNAIAQAETRFGRIDGVIHSVATSITERMRRIEQLSQVECDREFQAKVYGVLVLQQVLQGKQLDFCLLISSLASIFGGVGHAAYSAANLFLDAFCQHNQTNSVPWISVNWDGRVPFLPGLNVNPELTMTPQDDIEVFKRVLSRENGQIIVSTRNLQTRIDTWTNVEPIHSSGHFRPNLQTNYTPPRDRLERDIADIWQEVLGISQIGIHDNFFALGGDSLTGVTVINKFQQQLNQSIPIAAMFTAPTIAELVTHFTQKSLTPVLASISDREEGEL